MPAPSTLLITPVHTLPITLCHTATMYTLGADDFTPLLIYVVIKAATPYLASNLAYIERYRWGLLGGVC